MAYIVDLRSDTVTKPTEAMKHAMVNSALGDDVFGEDPTVNALESKVATLLGKQAALFVPSGTMANLIAIMVHCNKRGAEAIVGNLSHIYKYEQGGAAHVAGVLLSTIQNKPDGTFDLEELEKRFQGSDIHSPITSMVAIENTHNVCGGKVVPLEWMQQLSAVCVRHGILLHLDGARLMNAATYLQVPPASIAACCDSVAICFSKGLSAPAGSALAGSYSFIQQARRMRKMLGGGMRQAGVLAAAAIVSLDQVVPLLALDHKRAAILAKGTEKKLLIFNILTVRVSGPSLCERGGSTVPETCDLGLRSLMSVHPLPGLILEYRHLHKAHSTFITGIAHHVVNGVVKPTWDQTAAVTGRISSSNPNLQAIPKTFNLVLFPRDDAGPVPLSFRSVYGGRAGWRLVVADFKQVECRVLAHAARDQQLEQALTSDDLFIDLAARWLEKPVDEVSGKDRERTKRLVYAGLYGAGAKTMADILQLPHGQLEDLIHSFDRTFPSLKRFCKSVWSECSRGGGRVSTVGGRTRTFPNISSEDASLRAQAQRQAVNFIIQGSAAELCKRSMCECVCVLRRAGVAGHLLLAVHDELVWEVAEEHVPRAAEIIKSCMEGCGRQLGLRVPLPVALYTGGSWGQLEEYTHAGDREAMGQGHG